ncbi:MAG: hypothetical protein IPK50_20600 [Fibrobacterota bacterium]|nr:MAG: hypothetical protein IPK50_20600 [Fibrobacterota bacterium]
MRIKLSGKVIKSGGLSVIGLATMLLALPSQAAIVPCSANSVATLQACINRAPSLGAVSTDTVLVSVAPGLYSGAQIRINTRKNLWIIGDTTADEATQPRILYQDRQHVYTDLDPIKRADTSAAGTYGQNNGTVWIYQSDNIRLMGLVIDGSTTLTATTGRIFAYGATLGKTAPVEIRGNVGVNILLSRNVQLRYLSVTNTWNGISVISPNLGGAFAFPDPNDPYEERVSTLPTSRAGLYGNHLVERCRIHDNIFGMLFQRDWDLSSVIRNNLFWGNYMRHWDDPKLVAAGLTNYVAGLENLDKAKRADGSSRSLAYTTVGGAFLMTDVALTPYRIHNNTFHNNATIFSGYYKTGTQHLFYNNLVGRPYQFFRTAPDLEVQADAAGTSFGNGYTQTERNSEMLQYMSEHQRSNRVVAQDSVPRTTNVAPNYWGAAGGNFRLYNMRMIRTSQGTAGNWLGAGGRSWSNDDSNRDSLGMTWVPDTAALGTIAQQADTGGIVRWVRHNMWVGSRKDPSDPYNGNWCPPWIPIQIRNSLGDPKIFRNTGSFDLRWALGLPLDTISAATSANWLRPTASNLGLQGWATYEGTATKPFAIGAYDPAGGWAATARRLVLKDTLIETVNDSMVRFRLNVSGQGITDADIVKLEVSSAKFYNDVPVSDTLYNQGPTGTTGYTTTRLNSILSSKPWPLPYQFAATDYNRVGGHVVDDSLTKYKLRADNIFLGQIAPGWRLHQDSLYARAEVVLKATMADGSVIYSNPGVFMFSRPRFQFDVKITDLAGNDLPLDADGISRLVTARQPVRVTIRAKNIAKLPVDYKGYANLQLGDAGLLHGAGDNLQKQDLGVFNPLHPNDIVQARMLKNDSVVDTMRVEASTYLGAAVNGTLIYRAVFWGENDSLLPYFLEGRSAPLKVVSGSIYQVTIDSVYRDSTLLFAPSVEIKTYLNDSAAGRRDTLLTDGKKTSDNLGYGDRSEQLRLVLQVRDRWGNPVLDSSSQDKGLYVRLAYVIANGRYPAVSLDPQLLTVDSAGVSQSSARFAFDKKGRVVATIAISSLATPGAIGALRASILDSLGKELGTVGAARNAGVPDTAWIRSSGTPMTVQWVTPAGARLNPFDAWVGDWIPVRLKMIKDRQGTTFTGKIGVSTVAPIAFYAAKGDAVPVTSAQFAGDSLSQIFWVRASDSTQTGYLQATADSAADRVFPLRFTYPSVTRSAFYDRDCDGRVDSLAVWFNGPLSYRDSNGVVAGDSLDVRFPHHFSSPSAKGVPQGAHVRDSLLTFGWNPGAVIPADLRANLLSVGNPLSKTRQVYTLTAPADLAKPVFLEASDNQSWSASGATDSFLVRFSETMDVSSFALGTAVPFTLVRNGVEIPLTTARLVSAVKAVDSGLYAFVVSSSSILGMNGDSLRINPALLRDLVGNQASDCHTTRALLVNSPFRPLDGYVLDVTGDGNADSVHLAFRDSLGSYPDRIFVRWGTPAETLTILKADLIAAGVKTSDSSFTMPTKGWIGQTIVIDGITVVNAPRTKGPADTAYYLGTTLRSWLRDRVPPVVIYSYVSQDVSNRDVKSRMDTLQVYFSETAYGCTIGQNPDSCLSLRDRATKAEFVFPKGAYISDTVTYSNGARWTILLPQDGNPINPNTDVRGTPSSKGGLLTDAGRNSAGDNASWIKILMDVPPPNKGWMMDRNGDGKVDGVYLEYSPARKPLPGILLPSFTFEWGTLAGSPVTLRSDSAYQVDSLHWMAVLNLPGEFGATSYGPAALRNLGTQITNSMFKFPVLDSVGPVLLPPAVLKPSAGSPGSDTVIVRPSEPMAPATLARLVEFRRNGVAIAADQVGFISATPRLDGSWMVVLAADSRFRPNPGDEVRLSTSGSARDQIGSGNVPHPAHPWVPLVGDLRVPYAAAYYDRSKDGRIETAVVEFAAPVPVGVVIRVTNPDGNKADFREYKVVAADSARTQFDISFADRPWAQDLTAWTATDLGLMVAPAGSDTAIHGRAFQISDRVEPVAVEAKLRLTSDTASFDTLIVKYSELVRVDQSKPIFLIRSAGDSTGAGKPVFSLFVIVDSVNKTITYLLRPVPRDTLQVNPKDGDWLRLTNAVTDLNGNSPGDVAKWVKVTGNTREFLPKPTLTNTLVQPQVKSGTKIEVPENTSVFRPTEPRGTGEWLRYNPVTGKVEPTGHSNTPKDIGDYTKGGSAATVFFVTTNVPTKLTIYIYDLVGTFVNTKELDITQEMLDAAPKSSIGLVDAGIQWFGEDVNLRVVGHGIYPTRLIAYRNPSQKEKDAGVIKGSISNTLVKVGVRPLSE